MEYNKTHTVEVVVMGLVPLFGALFFSWQLDNFLPYYGMLQFYSFNVSTLRIRNAVVPNAGARIRTFGGSLVVSSLALAFTLLINLLPYSVIHGHERLPGVQAVQTFIDPLKSVLLTVLLFGLVTTAVDVIKRGWWISEDRTVAKQFLVFFFSIFLFGALFQMSLPVASVVNIIIGGTVRTSSVEFFMISVWTVAYVITQLKVETTVRAATARRL